MMKKVFQNKTKIEEQILSASDKNNLKAICPSQAQAGAHFLYSINGR